MQRPPDRNGPLVIFSRAANEWINQVSRKHKEFADLQLTDAGRASLEQWAEAEFIYATLRLEHLDLSRKQVTRVISSAESANATDAMIVGLRDALRAVESLAKTSGRAAQLTPELLVTLHNLHSQESSFRTSAGDTRGAIKPVPAAHLAAIIDGACRWYTAESFAELNPIEQAAIVFLRLIEIQPFEQANQRTALIAASLFTLRSGLPLIIIKPEMEPAFHNALDEATRTNTKPMVELMASAVQATLEAMLVEGKRQK
jgi:Fic family protein